MGGVYNEQWQELRNEIEAVSGYNEVQNQQEELVKKRQVNLEIDKKKIVEQVKKIQDQKKEYQRKVKNKLEELIETLKTIPIQDVTNQITKNGNGIEGGVSPNKNRFENVVEKSKNKVSNPKSKIDSLKIIFVRSFNKTISELPEVLLDEVINQLGCSQEQTFLGNDISNILNQTGTNTTSIYIPLQSLDLFGILQNDPDSLIGKIYYETGTTFNTQINGTEPFNKDLYALTQTPGQSYLSTTGNFYNGVSNQSLFNVEYTTTDNLGNQGNFYKVDLINRLNGKNVISQFLTDYYSTLEVVNLQNLLGQIFDIICGSVSIQSNLSSQQLEIKTKWQLLIERVLGLCFDNREEIDVSGISKISPTQNVDSSFFEFSDIDLREIDYTIDNLKKGVVEFQDCSNVKLPVNNEQINSEILNILNASTPDEILQVFEQVENAFVNNLQNNVMLPGIQLRLVVDTELLKAIPKAMFSSLITPKILFGFYVMFAASFTGYRQVFDKVNNLVDFAQVFSKLFINLSTRVIEKFIKILVQEIKKELVLLLKVIIRELQKNVTTKKYAIILQLLTVGGLITKLIGDYKRCQSIIDEIQSIFDIALTGSRIEIPSILLPLARFRSGYSEVRAELQTIKEFQKVGIPTGPMPDGQPNLTVQSFFSSQQGMETERFLNSKTKLFIVPPPSVGLVVNAQPPFTAYGLNL
jgi:hypothetical protein